MSKLSPVDVESHFDQTIEYFQALEDYIANELYKCENCKTVFDEASDISEGGCSECYEPKNRGDNDDVRLGL